MSRFARKVIFFFLFVCLSRLYRLLRALTAHYTLNGARAVFRSHCPVRGLSIEIDRGRERSTLSKLSILSGTGFANLVLSWFCCSCVFVILVLFMCVHLLLACVSARICLLSVKLSSSSHMCRSICSLCSLHVLSASMCTAIPWYL